MAQCKCSKCGHEWTAKVDNPKSCPACKQYNWQDKTVPPGDMTQEEFNGILIDLIDKNPASHLLLIPGVYDLVSKEFNNAVLDEWAKVKGVEKDETCKSQI